MKLPTPSTTYWQYLQWTIPQAPHPTLPMSQFRYTMIIIEFQKKLSHLIVDNNNIIKVRSTKVVTMIFIAWSVILFTGILYQYKRSGDYHCHTNWGWSSDASGPNYTVSTNYWGIICSSPYEFYACSLSCRSLRNVGGINVNIYDIEGIVERVPNPNASPQKRQDVILVSK